MKQPWDRLEGERSKAYHYFCMYRDMGVERTMNKLRQALIEGHAEIIPTLARLGMMSTRNGWVKRAEAYDDYLAEIQRKESEKELLEMYAVHAKAGRALADSGVKRLIKERDDGIDISASEARHRIKEGFEIEARARGVTLEKEEVDITGKLNIVFTEDMKDA